MPEAGDLQHRSRRASDVADAGRSPPSKATRPSHIPTNRGTTDEIIPTAATLLFLQRTVGNQALDTALSTSTSCSVPVQRFIEESEVRSTFPHLARFETLDEMGKKSVRVALKVDESDDVPIKTAILKMLRTVAGIVLHDKSNTTIPVAGLEIEVTFKWTGTDLLIKVIAPPGVPFDQRTFGVVRAVQFEDGTPFLYEDRLDVGKEYRGGGAGAVITRSGLQLAEDLRIKKLTIEASSIGRYSWASMGFEPNEGEWDKVADGMLKALEGAVPAKWPAKTARAVFERFGLPKPPDLEALGVQILAGPPNDSPLGLPADLQDAAVDALERIFRPVAKDLTGGDDINGKEPPNEWSDYLDDKSLARYLAKESLRALLELKDLPEALVATHAPQERLAAATMPVGQPPVDKVLSKTAFDQLWEIISKPSRVTHSLYDVVRLSRDLKSSDAESSEFIRQLVIRSATWKGSAKLDDPDVMARFKESVGWKA